MTLISEQNFFSYGWCSIYIFLSVYNGRHTESLLLRMSRQRKNFKFMYQLTPNPKMTQNEACPVGHLTFVSKSWSASQAKGFRNSLRVHGFTVLLEHLRAFEKAR